MSGRESARWDLTGGLYLDWQIGIENGLKSRERPPHFPDDDLWLRILARTPIGPDRRGGSFFGECDFREQPVALAGDLHELARECCGPHRFIREPMPLLAQFGDAVLELKKVGLGFGEELLEFIDLVRFPLELSLKLHAQQLRAAHVVEQRIILQTQCGAEIWIRQRAGGLRVSGRRVRERLR